MRTTRFFLASIFSAVLVYSAISKAEDIDIYSGLSGAAGVPNVLIVMDTGANFSGNASPGCSAYASGGAPSLGTDKNAGVEQCALVDAIDALPVGTVNIGLMVYNAKDLTSGAASGVGPCIGDSKGNGGCLVKPLTLMDAAGKSALINFIKTWTSSGSNSATAFNVKTNNEQTGAAMQEAWAYYNGKTGMSGTDYATSIVGAGCQKNFVIYIGNSFSNSGTPGDSNADPSDSTNGLNSSQVVPAALHDTSGNLTKLTDTVKFPSTTCGVTQLAAGSAASDWSNNWLDEWARYMHDADASSTLTDTQNITTYTIGVINNGTNSCKPDYPALLKNTAKYGGGKYFQTGTSSEIQQAILKILNEVQAVNSVFASSSLPVSVNTQGTFLNQVFIGMFRPDANGNPRWLGNLKQYQFLLDTDGSVSLGDSLGKSAISSAGTGFISSNAVSYWTCGGASTNADKRACSPVADPTGGFWVNQPQGNYGAYDLNDGELVEKGGAAQILRLANLTDDYTTTAGTTTNPRKLYTYCPSGSSCNNALTNSSNAFSVSNAGITAAMFGGSSRLNVTSIVRSGTTALVTTNTNHGFTTGDSVTISGATQTEYNVTQNVTVNSANTFTLTGLPDYPNTPSTGVYIAAVHNAGAVQSITSVSVATSTTANANGCTSGTIPNINCNQVTVNLPAHGYSNGDNIVISGVSPAQYSGTFAIGNVTTNTFTYNVPITPTSPSQNAYSAQLPVTTLTITQIDVPKNGTTYTATVNNTFSAGDSVTIKGNTYSPANGTYTILTASSSNFTYSSTKSTGSANSGAGGTVVLNKPVISIAAGNISRASVTATTATATGITASAFSNGQTINLTYASGANTNESAYAPISGSKSVVITCSGTCTSFTFPITTTPSTTTLTTTSPTAAVSIPVTIPIGAITRSGSGTTATVTGVANTFVNGQYIDISVSGSAVGTESAYLSPTAGWTITCPVSCSTAFTFGPVTQTPTTPATGTITTYAGSTPPDRTSLINWVRGQDNYGDEVASPGSPITVRPSIHGDVLHSRPVVINYGGTTGVVAFYGSNDGVFHVVNANQTNPASSTLPIPGSELWGFIPTESYSRLDRLRTNTPQLALPTTPAGIVPTPQKKDYFADGATGVYQEVNSSGTTTTADIYITMRRGGGVIYALNVLDPTSPQFLWKKSNVDTGFEELAQTWSRPKTAKLAGYANAVLIFGAGYDTAEDSEPPATRTQGRGIFIVDAVTGALVWSATHQITGSTACSGTATQASCLVSGMDYSIPSDITLIDHNGDGKIDRLYAVDMGGNVWRVDFEPTTTNITPQYWQINKLAALGCSTGVCGSGVTPRKFFFPPDVVPASGYDIVLVGSGDREHPLLTNASYSITNRFYALTDVNTGNDGSSQTTPITEASLFDATNTTYTYASTNSGFYITLATGEKSVNAAATIAGVTYFGTNQPAATGGNSCTTNLGIARGYQISPFTGNGSFSTFEGGGLPPTPVYGLVEIVRVDASGSVVLDNDGNPIIDQVPFCIGCGGGGTSGAGATGGCASDPTAAGCGGGGGGGGGSLCGASTPLEACRAIINASTDRHRTYWYLDTDQ
jgi:type IV pilus assembly protein PilY1